MTSISLRPAIIHNSSWRVCQNARKNNPPKNAFTAELPVNVQSPDKTASGVGVGGAVSRRDGKICARDGRLIIREPCRRRFLRAHYPTGGILVLLPIFFFFFQFLHFLSVTRNSFPPELLLNLDWWETRGAVAATL